MDRLPMVLWKPENSPTELISGDGEFNETSFQDFLKRVKVHGVSYAVVAIMGPQSSGKSTLMNHLFRTNFKEMNALNGRRQTTKGVWIAKAPEMEPFSIVLDLEGTDGLERGAEDDTTFERQSAAFALAVADVVIINMWCHDIGRQHAANTPLLKTIFEAMLHLFGPHKVTLLFVLRDKTRTPFDKLERDLRKDVEKIWETVRKPHGREDTTLSHIFNVEVTALSNYESVPNDTFKNEVAQLRSRFSHSILSPINVKPGSEVISLGSSKKIWDIIKEYKDLDLPSQKVMLATVRCEEIAMDKLGRFASDVDWLVLEEAATSRLVSDFSTTMSSIFDKYLSEYDSECVRYENDVSRAKREYLASELLKVVRPAYMKMLGHRRSDASRRFESRLKAALSEGEGFAECVRTCEECCVLEFDEQCRSDGATFSNDVSTVRYELVSDIEKHSLLVRVDKLPHIAEQQLERLTNKFSRELKNFISYFRTEDIWAAIRDMLKSEGDAAALALSFAVVEFELDGATVEQMVDDLTRNARKIVVTKFKEETQDVQLLLKQRFITALSELEHSKPSDLEGVRATWEGAYRECVKLLSTIAVTRLDGDGDGNVESVLLSALMAPHQISPDPLDSPTWEKVPPEMTLITPVKCREIWDEFKPYMERTYPELKNVEEKCEEAKHWRLPTWAIVGLLVLGFAGFNAYARSHGMDVKLALSLVDPGIIIVEKGIDLVRKGIDVVRKGISTYKDIDQLNQEVDIDSKGFRRRYRKLMKKLKLALKKFYKFMMSLLEKEEATKESV